MASKQEELRERTKQFAIRVVHLFRALPKTEDARVMGRQLLRSATSVAANYRAACRALSHPHFVAKIGLVLEESDESAFWLEMLADTGVMKPERLADLKREADELVAIFSASYATAKSKSLKAKPAALRRNRAIAQSRNR